MTTETPNQQETVTFEDESVIVSFSIPIKAA